MLLLPLIRSVHNTYAPLVPPSNLRTCRQSATSSYKMRLFTVFIVVAAERYMVLCFAVIETTCYIFMVINHFVHEANMLLPEYYSN